MCQNGDYIFEKYTEYDLMKKLPFFKYYHRIEIIKQVTSREKFIFFLCPKYLFCVKVF